MLYRKLDNCELNRSSPEEFRSVEKTAVVIVLDNVRSQHNIGASFRTADAFAIERVVLCGICATPPSAEIRKAALGAEESVEWSYFEKSTDAVIALKKEGYRVWSVEQTENSTSLENFTPVNGEKYALVFGNEVKGVMQEVIDLGDGAIEIPQYGTKHSLNVSVSVGVVLWDVVKKMRRVNNG
ncbi:MAG: RNA methyltransferase [Bacteroidales bacterium]